MSNEFLANSDQSSEDTGRYIIFYEPSELRSISRSAKNISGIDLPASLDAAKEAIASDNWHAQDSIVLPLLGVAVTNASKEQVDRLEINAKSSIRSIRKEYVFEISNQFSKADGVNVSLDYLLGYRDATNALISNLLPNDSLDADAVIQSGETFMDSAEFTWGLQATGVNQTKLTGKGVRIAILDTGYDMQHPDFDGLSIQSKNFVAAAASAQDDNGHGTHCLGTLAGPPVPSAGARYGIAFGAEIFVGKVMKANGRGNELDILHGINWALENDCRIISLSLGKPVEVGESPDKEYEEIGAVALDRNCLIIAAAGNGSNRPGKTLPVELPANSKKIMAVGAIDRRLALYTNSNAGINSSNGGGVDLVAPGVNVYSSKIAPPTPHYGLSSGTSMATPHVAGIAALLMESEKEANAEQIWTKLTQNAKRLSLGSVDAGSGLVQVS